MAGQEGINIKFGAQREFQLVTTNLTLDRYDTGKLLALQGGVARTACITCSLPAIADVDQGWYCTILAVSDHPHAIVATGPLMSGSFYNSGSLGMGMPGVTALTGSTNVVLSADFSDDLRGTQIQIFCDGTNWFVLGHSRGGPVRIDAP